MFWVSFDVSSVESRINLVSKLMAKGYFHDSELEELLIRAKRLERRHQRFDSNGDILEFNGKSHGDEFFDWLNSV